MRRISASSASLLALLLVAACADRVPDPVAVAGVPQAVNAGSFVQLDGTASHDPQDRSLTYSWVIVKRPVGSNAQLVDANTPTPSFLADKPGEYVIELTVSNSLFSTKSQVTVIVSTCKATAPVVGAIHSSKTTMNIGDTTQLTADVSDGDNLAPCSQSQTFTYSWEVLRQPSGSTASLNNAHSETPSLTADKAGDYVVRLTVTDSTGLSSEPKTLTVTAEGSGMFFASVKRGTYVDKGTQIGYVTDALGAVTAEARAPEAGVVTFVRSVPSLKQGDTILAIGTRTGDTVAATSIRRGTGGFGIRQRDRTTTTDATDAPTPS